MTTSQKKTETCEHEYGCFEIAPEESEPSSMPRYIVVMYVLLALVIALLVAFAVYVAAASVKKRKNE